MSQNVQCLSTSKLVLSQLHDIPCIKWRDFVQHSDIKRCSTSPTCTGILKETCSCAKLERNAAFFEKEYIYIYIYQSLLRETYSCAKLLKRAQGNLWKEDGHCYVVGFFGYGCTCAIYCNMLKGSYICNIGYMFILFKGGYFQCIALVTNVLYT